MRLSKLKLAGFKSFVDPTVVLTPGQLVGIVGPNGCGKSNLIDAVRWVLGESRASALRGESMQDVIFNGSTARAPVSRASVELVFDNAAGRAAGQWSHYAEIAVKRLVDRVGGSDYFINNIRVRRKDVVDLFLGTGLGPRAYAIIEQGMISRVIEARPEDVRAFLEEAAGITRYKERRRETEGRLADASDNLARVEDIRAELGQQIGRLAGQAEVARRYKELQASLSARQVLLWRYRHTLAGREVQAVAAALAGATVGLEERNAALVEVESRLLLARDALAVHAEAVSSAQGDLYAISAELARVEGEIRRLHETRDRLAQRANQLAAEQEGWQARLATLAEERRRWTGMREQSTLRLEEATCLAEGAGSALALAEQSWRDATALREQQRHLNAQLDQQLRVMETRRAASQSALDALARRRQRIDVERVSLQPIDAQALPLLEAGMAELEEQLAAAGERQQTLTAHHHSLQDQLTQAQEQLALLGKRVTEQRARLNALCHLQARLRDQGDLAEWLRCAGLADHSPLWQSLHVEAGWELAVEAVLRERIGALGPFADPMPDALLLSPSPATVVVLRETPAWSGAVAFPGRALAQSVRCESLVLEPFVASWLEGVYAVEDAAAWLAGGAELPESVLLVSRAGQIVSRTSLTLFAPDARTHGAIERQREIEELTAGLEAEELALAAAREAAAGAADALQQCQLEVAQVQQFAQQARSQIHARQIDIVKLGQELVRFEETSLRFRREAAEVGDMEQQERTHLEAFETERVAKEHHLSLAQGALREAEATVAAREEALQQAREEATQAHRSVQEAGFSLRECQTRLDEIGRNEQFAQAQLDKGQTELARLGQERGALDESALQIALQTALDLRGGRESALAVRRNEQEEAVRAAKALDEARLRLEHELGPLREQIGELKLRQQAAELSVAQAGERLGELGVELLVLTATELDEVKEAALNREVVRLGRELAELGPVNLAALQELEAATQRKHFLDVQYEDLSTAIDTLQGAIRRIDRETREQLASTYETVNRHFGELFPRLFGGGEARLVLAGDEILNAGIQIVACPPGKKNTSIHLLSGGEKALTAIALVFAMFQLNPAPFCMLDEVDAPLDDTNTERYCEMVKQMSSGTQFVFISHSKITMEMARQLVGVTMQEQGVSRVVEVDIDAAIRLAQPVAG